MHGTSAYFILLVTAAAATVQVTFHGSGLSEEEGESVLLMGRCDHDPIKEIGNATVRAGGWTVNTEIKPCVLHWRWRLGSGSSELIPFGDRQTFIPDVKRPVVIHSTFSFNDARLYQDQEVQFVLENPPQLDKSYQVCGMCTGAPVRPGFDKWTCSESVLPSDNMVVINKQLTTWCNYEWKWRNGANEEDSENLGGKRIHIFDEQGQCKDLGVTVFRDRWSEHVTKEKLCENKIPTTTISASWTTGGSATPSKDDSTTGIGPAEATTYGATTV